MKTSRCDTVEYKAWLDLRYRCNNKNSSRYSKYGGRGISVCDRWEVFENFLEDMGERPDGMSIDRIDNDKGYSPENCKWSTSSEQACNRSSNTIISFNGISMTSAEWNRHLGGNDSLVYHRLKRGWSIEKALTTPVRRRVK